MNEGGDTGCSEAGTWWPNYQYGMGQCPIRREPCPTGCLLKTIVSMKLAIDSQPLREEVRQKLARREGILEAARLAKKVGSKAVARAIEALVRE